MNRNEMAEQIRAAGVTAGHDRIRRMVHNLINQGGNKMGKKTAYVLSLVAEEIPFPADVITKLKWFKKTHKNPKVAELDTMPPEWKQMIINERFRGMKELLTVFCGAYQMEAIELRMQNISFEGESAMSFWNEEDRYILLTGKLSVITFCHEFAHAMGMDEEQARKWSLTLFKNVYPIAFEKLSSPPGATETDFYLVAAPRLPAAVIVPVGQPTPLDAGNPVEAADPAQA